MRRTDAAEWVLSLSTARDRAAAIAGDLSEQAPTYGALWFWGSLIRTTTSLTWRAFAEAPLRVTGMALLGLFLQLIFTVPVQLGMMFVHFAFAIRLQRRGPAESFVWVASVEAAVAILVTSYFLGKWLARKAPQRELAVLASIWVISHLLWIPILLIVPRVTQSQPIGMDNLLMDIFATVGMTVCALAGIRRQRRRSYELLSSQKSAR